MRSAVLDLTRSISNLSEIMARNANPNNCACKAESPHSLRSDGRVFVTPDSVLDSPPPTDFQTGLNTAPTLPKQKTKLKHPHRPVQQNTKIPLQRWSQIVTRYKDCQKNYPKYGKNAGEVLFWVWQNLASTSNPNHCLSRGMCMQTSASQSLTYFKTKLMTKLFNRKWKWNPQKTVRWVETTKKNFKEVISHCNK